MQQRAYQKYLLTVLMVSLAFTYVDRLALGLLLQNIKSDLSLSDTQLGVLTGFAFALFYSTMGLPIARWADRGNRVSIIAAATAVWTAAVALCGYAMSFTQLLATRVCAAIGEAGSMPTAQSLIADYFTRAERPKALATYLAGSSLSFGIGYFLTGWLNEFYGWRWTFRILALPGGVLAGLIWLTLIEPRTASPAASRAANDSPAIRTVLVTLGRSKTFRQLLAYFSVISFFTSGIGQWQPAFFIRSHGLSTGELGTWLALLFGVGGVIGTYFGGSWASRHAANDERRQLRIGACVIATVGVISPFIYLAHDFRIAFALVGLTSIIGTTASGPLFATIQTLVPDRMRAVSIALIFLSANLIGGGLGPVIVGALSDLLRPWLGEESLRYALLAFTPGFLWGAWHVWAASTTVRGELDSTGLPGPRDEGPAASIASPQPLGLEA